MTVDQSNSGEADNQDGSASDKSLTTSLTDTSIDNNSSHQDATPKKRRKKQKGTDKKAVAKSVANEAIREVSPTFCNFASFTRFHIFYTGVR